MSTSCGKATAQTSVGRALIETVAHILSASRSELAIPAIVLYELEYGTLRSRFPARRRRDLEAGLEHIRHVPFDSAAARGAASIRVELEKQGTTIGFSIRRSPEQPSAAQPPS